MAKDHEVRLVSKIIRDRHLTPALEAGITAEWFAGDDSAEVYKFVADHFAQYGEVPTAVTVRDNYPTFPLQKVEDNLQYLVDAFVDWRRSTDTALALRDAVMAMEENNDHNLALQILSKSLVKIEGVGNLGTRDVDLTTNSDARLAAYEHLETTTDGMLGIPTGFPSIDKATAGLQPGQLITVIASPKTGKSVLALQIAINAHQDHGQVPVFQSFEMSNQEQQVRHDAIRAHISTNRLRRGQLKPQEKNRYVSMLNMMKEQQSFVLTDAVNGSTVSALESKLDKHNPNLLVIDGVYLMIDEQSGESNTPQALTNITRSLKRLAQRREIPIIITTQTLLWKMSKGRKVTADSIGYSSAFFQDSDVIIGLERTEDDDELSRILKIVESRNCGKVEVDLLWNWEEGQFMELESAYAQDNGLRPIDAEGGFDYE
jgi:replicative DNA helicase